jgi:hypothetical protein
MGVAGVPFGVGYLSDKLFRVLAGCLLEFSFLQCPKEVLSDAIYQCVFVFKTIVQEGNQ